MEIKPELKIDLFLPDDEQEGVDDLVHWLRSNERSQGHHDQCHPNRNSLIRRRRRRRKRYLSILKDLCTFIWSSKINLSFVNPSCLFDIRHNQGETKKEFISQSCTVSMCVLLLFVIAKLIDFKLILIDRHEWNKNRKKISLCQQRHWSVSSYKSLSMSISLTENIRMIDEINCELFFLVVLINSIISIRTRSRSSYDRNVALKIENRTIISIGNCWTSAI